VVGLKHRVLYLKKKYKHSKNYLAWLKLGWLEYRKKNVEKDKLPKII
jgi:hypothetical protein